MSKKMLIDAAHPEETRVVVLNGNRIEDFDFESRARKQLRGNIYLAKVTRVEPSLQAAFIEYGGNRHGFLAFNEIHPDYYQIPHADREALMREAEADDDLPDHSLDTGPSEEPSDDGDDHADHHAEALGGDDDDDMDEEIERRRRRLMRRYKIQEVIKRRQIMLVQVVKEERGNKGAALTTYLSLAGRYCVLMPNTDRGGGISRKISNVSDRKRLRGIVADCDVPEGMGLIVRTAGAKRSRAEITRDYEYLSRLWGTIRDTTLHSIAPALIYEEEDLVKRAIRDLFDKDLDGVWVEGDAGFREARNFMRMIMPSQAKKVQHYKGGPPLFVAHKIEDQLSQIYSPSVPLRSGGYLVINQTEALVAIDVNSGRATRERNIESTALKTNLEAAEEAARQLRLRDLAGLIVIDFIDMDEGKNNRAVEKVLKDCLALDRARIQMGRISGFGLMEISRQRRRTGILEGTTEVCPHCAGAGRIRSVESSALAALRAVDLEGLGGGGEIALRVPRAVSLYILNHKRDHLTRLLHRQGLFVRVEIDEVLGAAEHAIERISDVPFKVDPTWGDDVGDEDDDAFDAEAADIDDEDEDFAEDTVGSVDDVGSDEDEEDEDDGEDLRSSSAPQAPDEAGRRRRRRRRGRRGDEPRTAETAAVPAPVAVLEDDSEAGRRRRRGRRGGRRGRDEAAPNDPYAWSWPARLSGDDTYEWRGPVQAAASMPVDAETPTPRLAQAQPEEEFAFTAVDDASAPAMESLPPFSADEDVWVELEEPAPKAERPRRRRRRGGADSAESESVAAPEAEAISVAPETPSVEPELPVEASETPEPSPPAEAEPVPEPVDAPVAQAETPMPKPTLVEPSEPDHAPPTPPPPATEPDPAEIVAPPAQPKRGWWRSRA